MGTAIKTRAVELLAELIGCEIPELAGKICAGPAEASHKLGFPSLAIVPVRFKYFPDQALEVDELNASSILVNVGRHEGTVQLRLGSTTQRRRADLEEQILDVFLGQPLRPGVIVQQVPDCHDATIAWELEDETWEDEFAFDQKWYSTIVVTAQIPALVRRGDTYTLNDLRLALVEELNIPPFEIEEVISIDEDGDIAASVAP